MWEPLWATGLELKNILKSPMSDNEPNSGENGIAQIVGF